MSSCTPCNLNEYAPEASTACLSCPNGSWANVSIATTGAVGLAGEIGAASIHFCKCGKGLYSVLGGCAVCPAGKFSDANG